MAKVLVTDGEQRTALAVVRSLGRAGHEVHVAATSTRSLSGSSRYAAERHEVPSPLSDPNAFAARVAGIAHDTGAAVLLPVTDGSVLAVLEHAQLFRHVRLPFPELGTFEAASDKGHLAELAAKAGFHAPRQWRVPNAASLPDADIDPEREVAVKGATSVVGGPRERWVNRVRYARGLKELREIVAQQPSEVFPLLVQERIRGPGTGLFLLTWGGDVLARFAHRRIREKPPSGGVSVLRESIPVSPELFDAGHRLLRMLGWRGVAMLECKVDRESGRPYILEVNGRFWGSLQLAVDAGVDFPRLLVEACLGGRVHPVEEYRTGVRSRWFWGDVDHLLLSLARPEHPPETSSGRARLSALSGHLTALAPRTRSEVFRIRDPLPFARESMDWFRAAFSRPSPAPSGGPAPSPAGHREAPRRTGSGVSGQPTTPRRRTRKQETRSRRCLKGVSAHGGTPGPPSDLR